MFKVASLILPYLNIHCLLFLYLNSGSFTFEHTVCPKSPYKWFLFVFCSTSRLSKCHYSLWVTIIVGHLLWTYFGQWQTSPIWSGKDLFLCLKEKYSCYWRSPLFKNILKMPNFYPYTLGIMKLLISTNNIFKRLLRTFGKFCIHML